MAILGVRVYEQATSVSTPNVAKVGVLTDVACS